MTAGARRIAVIIPGYNAAGVIGDALASVAAQTVPPDEVIVADDCSTDGTAGLARDWSDRLPITVVRTASNGGPGLARRTAIAACGGELVALLDADDVWLPEHVEVMLECHRRGVVVTADPTTWLPGEGLGDRWSQRHPLPPTDQLAHLCRRNDVFSGTVFERRLYEDVGGFRPRLRVGEDWDLWIRMARAGGQFVRPTQSTVRYRVGGISMSGDARAGDDRVAVLELARREATSDGERRAINEGLRMVRAERDLFTAYRLAMDGRRMTARRRAVGALAGHRRVALRAAAMLVAPAAVARRRARARADPRARLRE